EETIEAYKKSRELYAQSSKKQAAARLLDIGNIYRNNLSDYTSALEYYDLAAEELKALDEGESYLSVQFDKANTKMAIGQIGRAIAILERVVIPAINKDKQVVLWVRATQILANAFYRAGVYQRAQELNDQAFVATQAIDGDVIRVDRQLDAMSLRGMIL